MATKFAKIDKELIFELFLFLVTKESQSSTQRVQLMIGVITPICTKFVVCVCFFK